MRLQDFLYDTGFNKGKGWVYESLTVPSKKTNPRRHRGPEYPFYSLSLLYTPGREEEMVKWL